MNLFKVIITVFAHKRLFAQKWLLSTTYFFFCCCTCKLMLHFLAFLDNGTCSLLNHFVIAACC